MENQNSPFQSFPTAGANLPDQTLGAIQANVPSCTTGVSVRGNLTAETVLSVIVNSSPSTTSQTTRRHLFRFNILLANEHFKGREDILNDVRDFFLKVPADTSNFCDRIVVIAGCGGIGKTETAYKVAALFEDLFPSVAWIDAETEDSLLKSFLGLAKKVGVPSSDLKLPATDLAKAVYEYIDENDYGNVLFIFDNAVRFNSSGGEFGIFDYLPTETLINKRYPYILITTQTHEWGKQTKVLQVHGLSEKDSLEFFRSSFRVNSPECDDEFKTLYKVTEGYPLVMNLAASNIDYNRHPNDSSIRELQRKIHLYIQDLEKESGKILTEEMKHWPTSYKKTLSAAWQLTFKRLEQERNGLEAFKVLQIMSFLELPFDSDNVIDIFSLQAACPHPVNLELQLKELLYLLERFYAARILRGYRENADGFHCVLGMHRLVQLAVRQQTNCSQVLEGIFCHEVLCWYGFMSTLVSTSVFHEALKKADLCPRALVSVEILACAGVPIARHIAWTRTPQTKAAETVRHLYNLQRGLTPLSAGTVLLLTELIERAKSAEITGVQLMYFVVAFNLLNREIIERLREDATEAQNYFDLSSLRGIEKPACELILEFVSFGECRCCSCEWVNRIRHFFGHARKLLTNLINEFVHADVQQADSMRTHLTHAFLNCIPLLKQWDQWHIFWNEISEIVYSRPVSQSRMAELKKSLWDHGLAEKLEKTMKSSHYLQLTLFNSFVFTRCMDFCLDGMDLTDQRVQQVLSAFSEMTARFLAEIPDSNENAMLTCHFVCDVCSVWILLLLIHEPSEYLLELLSRCAALTWLQGDRADISHFNLVSSEFKRFSTLFRENDKSKLSQFIQKYSSSEMERMQTLVAFCRMIFS